jgi:hypothetical protein
MYKLIFKILILKLLKVLYNFFFIHLFNLIKITHICYPFYLFRNKIFK